MIRLFICDIDGCLAMPYQPVNLKSWDTLSDYAMEGEQPEAPRPRITICSGRPRPYVEAVSQALNLHVPAMFEGGGGYFYLPKGKVVWHPSFTDEMARDMEEVKHWLVTECIPGTKLSFDYSKRTQAGLIGPDTPAVERLVPEVEAFVEQRFPLFRVFNTPISIDVVPKTITKRQALDWLSEQTDIPLEEMAFIGDTNGDLEALQAVGYSFAPQNAAPMVKDAVSYVAEGSAVDAVLEAIEWSTKHNRSHVDISQAL